MTPEDTIVGGGGDGGEGGGTAPGGEGGTRGGSGGGGEGIGGGETTKVAVPLPPLASSKVWSVQSGADHTLPFHPSPYVSTMSSVQVPGGTACVSE